MSFNYGTMHKEARSPGKITISPITTKGFLKKPGHSETSHHKTRLWLCFCLFTLSRVSSHTSLPSFPIAKDLAVTLTTSTLTEMGCAPSKPARPRSREIDTSFPRYTGPKKFRGSVMPERRPHRQAAEMHQTYQQPEQQPRPHRQAAQMYQTYQEQDQRRMIGEERRYSWEGHSSERTFTTFESLAERGIIPKSALKRK